MAVMVFAANRPAASLSKCRAISVICGYRFSGIITEEDAQAMSQAIEEGREQVDAEHLAN